MAEETKHTPGPLMTQPTDHMDGSVWTCIYDKFGVDHLACVEDKDDATLYATAPELLEALKEAQAKIRNFYLPIHPMVAAIEEVIAKATGTPTSSEGD